MGTYDKMSAIDKKIMEEIDKIKVLFSKLKQEAVVSALDYNDEDFAYKIYMSEKGNLTIEIAPEQIDNFMKLLQDKKGNK